MSQVKPSSASRSSSSSTSNTTTIMNPFFEHFRQQQIKTGRKTSLFGSDKTHCLCTVLKPLIILLQALGIFPLSRDVEHCKLHHFWYSIPAWITYLWILFILILSSWLVTSLTNITKLVLSGTDFYTINVMFMVNVLASIFVYISGSFNCIYFSKGWDRLHITLEELALPNFKMVKRAVYLIPILILEEFIADSSIMLFSYMNDQLDIENAALVVAGSSFVANLVPNVICGSYTVLCWIVAMHFKAINDQVETIMKDSSKQCTLDVIDFTHEGKGLKTDNLMMVAKMSRLRMLHENLCDAVRHLEKSFGTQLLAVFCATGISFVGGLYSFIVISNELVESTKLTKLSYAYSISSVLSGIRLLVVLCICQYLTDKSNQTGNILNAHDIDACSDEMKRQVEQFKTKLGSFPLSISCCHVFPLSTSILASATGNIVTYVLVLMQFKLNSKTFPETTDAHLVGAAVNHTDL